MNNTLGYAIDIAMKKEKDTIYICTKCDAQSSKWSGRCLECGSWGTIEESMASSSSTKNRSAQLDTATEIVNLSKVERQNFERINTGIDELDRVLGGGLVPGSLILLAGEPGIGKSTILAQMTDAVSKKITPSEGVPVLYISGEESAPQVRDRFKRLNCDLESIFFATETNTEKIRSTVLKDNPKFLIIDSIQTMRNPLVPSESGSVNQIRAATASFMEIAKQNNVSVIITGHITKDGQVAGPKTLEHMVDTVIYLEHDQSLQYRLLRSTKNRFGSVNEIGIFEMTGQGFVQVKNPSTVFMDSGGGVTSGSAVSCVVEGSRAFLVEVQALVSKTVFGYPQRKSTGVDANRLQILAAVLQKRAGLNLSAHDIILNVVGGMKVNEPAIDLAICASIISSFYNKNLSRQALFLGEVGLGGEVRNVGKIKERIMEATRLGFKEMYLPDLNISSSKLKINKIDKIDKLLEFIK